MTLKELREKYNSLYDNAETLLADINKAVVADELDESRIEEMNTDYDQAVKQMGLIKAQMTKLEEAEEARKSANRLPFDTTGEEETDKSNDTPDSLNDPAYVLKFGEIDNAVKSVIKDLYGFDYNQKRAQQLQIFGKFVRYGENRLTSAERKLANELIVTPDVLKFDIKAGMGVGGPDGLKATLQESVGELGGYLVPEDFRSEIIRRIQGYAVVRGRARTVTTTRNLVEWPRIEGGDSRYTSAVRVTHINEVPSSATVAETNPTFGFVSIPVNTVMARTDLSQNQLEDSAFDLVDVLADLYAEAFAIDENDDFLTGAGGNHARGVLANRSGAEKTPEDGITAVNSGNASALTADGIVDLIFDLDDQYANDAIMVAAKQTYRNIRKLKTGDGEYIWERGFGEAFDQGGGRTRMAILGVPGLQDEGVPAVAANAYPIVYGNWRAGYVIVDRVGMSVRRVEDTTTAGQNTIALFGRKRYGGAVVAPWAFRVQKVSA